MIQEIPQEAQEFRYENMLIKYTKSRDGSVTGFIVKNIDTPYLHYHIYVKDNKPFFLQTMEGIKKEYLPVDIEKAAQVLARLMERIFSLAEKIERDDKRFLGKQIVLLHRLDLQIDKIKGKEVRLSRNYDQNILSFEELDTTKNWMGGIVDDQPNDTHMIFCKDGQIFVIDFSNIKSDSDAKEFESIMNPFNEN